MQQGTVTVPAFSRAADTRPTGTITAYFYQVAEKLRETRHE